VNYVADQFFGATGMRLVQGRGITAADRSGAPVAVVNEALAAAAWPGRSPLGECAYLSRARETCARVVGVVRNAHTFGVREEQRPWVYVPLSPSDKGNRVLLARVAPGARGMDGTLGRVLRELEPAVPYVQVRTLGEALDPEIRPWRLGAAVFTAVAQRTREIGVRVALGASAPSVARLVLGDGLRIAVAGVAVGLGLALVGGRWVAALLFDTSPRDPAVLSAVGLALLTVAVAASILPARRAARVNPTEALRAE
jgi:putative ABC transport system permease protein